MGKALCVKSSGEIVGWIRWGNHAFNSATHVEVDADDAPDRETETWDGATGLRSKTAQELADDATAKLNNEAVNAFDDMKAIKALALVLADEVGKTPKQIRDAAIAKYKGL